MPVFTDEEMSEMIREAGEACNPKLFKEFEEWCEEQNNLADDLSIPVPINEQSSVDSASDSSMDCSVETAIEKSTSDLVPENENQEYILRLVDANDAQINDSSQSEECNVDRVENPSIAISKAERVKKWIEDQNQTSIDPETSANLSFFDVSTDADPNKRTKKIYCQATRTWIEIDAAKSSDSDETEAESLKLPELTSIEKSNDESSLANLIIDESTTSDTHRPPSSQDNRASQSSDMSSMFDNDSIRPLKRKKPLKENNALSASTSKVQRQQKQPEAQKENRRVRTEQPGPSSRPSVEVSRPKKQKRKFWTLEEEESLIRVYAIAGGNKSQSYPDEDWIKIKEMMGTTRTNINLKDKIRNLKKIGRIPYNS